MKLANDDEIQDDDDDNIAKSHNKKAGDDTQKTYPTGRKYISQQDVKKTSRDTAVSLYLNLHENSISFPH